jgi:hypothetical protein
MPTVAGHLQVVASGYRRDKPPPATVPVMAERPSPNVLFRLAGAAPLALSVVMPWSSDRAAVILVEFDSAVVVWACHYTLSLVPSSALYLFCCSSTPSCMLCSASVPCIDIVHDVCCSIRTCRAFCVCMSCVDRWQEASTRSSLLWWAVLVVAGLPKINHRCPEVKQDDCI